MDIVYIIEHNDARQYVDYITMYGYDTSHLQYAIEVRAMHIISYIINTIKPHSSELWEARDTLDKIPYDKQYYNVINTMICDSLQI